MIPVMAAATSGVPAALNALPTAAAVALLCVGVVAEIVVVPGVLLPGGTMTLIAGALIGTGRPLLAVAIPMILAIIGADQLAYFGGAAVIDWWRRRRPGRADRAARERPERRVQTAVWLTAAMPSLAGAVRLPYRAFAVRLLIMRVPWLAAALSVGTLAARSLAEIGHVAGIVGLAASAVVICGFVVARHRPALARALRRDVDERKRKSSSTLL